MQELLKSRHIFRDFVLFYYRICDRPIDWLIDWLIDWWLIDWLTGLIDCRVFACIISEAKCLQSVSQSQPSLFRNQIASSNFFFFINSSRFFDALSNLKKRRKKALWNYTHLFAYIHIFTLPPLGPIDEFTYPSPSTQSIPNSYK